MLRSICLRDYILEQILNYVRNPYLWNGVVGLLCLPVLCWQLVLTLLPSPLIRFGVPYVVRKGLTHNGNLPLWNGVRSNF